jgi:uncharacterized protein YdaU (DUF1376 family)
MHYFQFHIGDYKSHTHHLSLIEDLAFRRLLDHYYLHEHPIKQRDIARQIGMREHEQDVLTVLNEFFVSTESGFINPRADEEIAKYRKFIEDGKRGAAKRWLKGDDSPPIATPIATINHKPITINQEPKKKATVVALPDGVGEQVWEDWLQLRKAKKAPVTQTVVNSATKEAEKAGISLNAFLTIWCARGSQGLEAEWLKSNERQPFANKFDVAHITTPPPPNQDAALRKIEEDSKRAAKPSLEVLARMAELRKGVA